MRITVTMAWVGLAFVARAQQAGSTAQFTRATVAVAPSPAAAGAAGQGAGPAGGISFVTRPSSRIGPVLAASSFFAAGGVRVAPSGAAPSTGAGVGGLAVAGTTPQSRPGPGAVQTLREMAAGGDENARRALAWMDAANARTSPARRR